MKYTALIFDLDGTLLNTLEDLCDSVNFAMQTCGYPPRTLEEVRSFVGNGIGRLIALSVPEGTGEEEGKKALAAFQSHYILNCNNKTRPYDGILELLRRARSLGCKTAIVSNKVDAAVKRLTERYFDGLIDVAIGESENIRRKPWPDTVRKALEELQTDPGSAVYIGDSEVDVATAYNADLPCLSVSWGFRSKEELIEAGAELIVDRPEEILRFLELD